MIRVLVPLLAVLLPVPLAFADVAPRRAPPRPAGPDSATLRGLEVGQALVDARSRWSILVSRCAPTQPGCRGRDLTLCRVVAVGGTRLASGDIAALQRAVRAASGPVRLELSGCSVDAVTLEP